MKYDWKEPKVVWSDVRERRAVQQFGQHVVYEYPEDNGFFVIDDRTGEVVAQEDLLANAWGVAKKLDNDTIDNKRLPTKSSVTPSGRRVYPSDRRAMAALVVQLEGDEAPAAARLTNASRLPGWSVQKYAKSKGQYWMWKDDVMLLETKTRAEAVEFLREHWLEEARVELATHLR